MPTPHGLRAHFITTDYPPDLGGLQTYSLRIARELPESLLSRVLVGSDHSPAELPPPMPGVGLTVSRGRDRISAFIWGMRHIPWFRFRHKLNFQLHMQWTTAIPSLLLKKSGAGTHYAVLIHGAELLDPGRPLLRLLKTVVLENADAVIAGSRHTAEILAQQGIECKRLEVIPYGNPLEGIQAPRPADNSNVEGTVTPKLLCMHRLVSRKGTTVLLEALAGLTHRSWTLDIVGKGEEESALRALTEKLGLSERVNFHAPVTEGEKIGLLRNASLFILPSLPPQGNNHFEGLGLTLLEAQSQGVPVLAARTGGISEAVQEGLTGVLFRAGDAEDLREKLGTLLSSPETLKAMGLAGPAWVESHFSWKDGLEKLAAVMLEVSRT